MKKFEFVLYINGNIICQRYFTVKNYNRKSLRSMDLVWCLESVTKMIKKDLKAKSEDFLWRQFNPYREQKPEDVNREDVYENEDVFDFEIKVDDRAVAKTKFTGNVYPQRVRYSVDIRKMIPSIISEIQNTFSEENLTVEYCGIEL
jgi:hypothetical protein